MSTIKTKNSTTPSAVPSAASLSQGELAVNIADKKLFVGNASGDPVELTNQGVLSINGATGAITNVAFTNVDNNFSVGQTFASNVTVSGNLTGATAAFSQQVTVGPLFGVNKTDPAYAADINAAAGNCLRLIYNSSS